MNMWKKNVNPIGILYSWFLAEVSLASECVIHGFELLLYFLK